MEGQHPTTRTGVGAGSALAQGLLLVVGVGAAMRASLGSHAWSVIRAAALYSAIMMLVMRSLPAHHPFTRFGSANHVTTVRAAIVSVLAALVGEPRTADMAGVVVALGTIAAVLDGVDGWLARRSGMQSALGARFDMEVDALLILVLAILVWRFEKAGAWVLLAGVLRYGFLAGGWTASWMRRPLPPSRRRQAVCVVQVAALNAALLPMVPPRTSSWVLGIALVVLSYSFALDTAWLWRHRTGVRIAVPS